MYIGELDDFGMLDIGRDDNHHGMEVVHIDLGTIVGTTDFHLRLVSVRVNHLKALHHIGSGQPVGIASLRSLELDDTRLTRQGEHIAADGGRAFHHLEADGQSRRSCGHKGNRIIENQLVGNVGHFDELGIAVGLLTHEEVIEAARATLRVEEDAVPHLVVVRVATAWGEVHADIGAASHLYPFALAARLDEHRHRACAVEGREVERHLVARPAALFIVERNTAAVGQTNLGMAAVALALDEEIDAAIGVGHARQDVTIAVAIEAHAEERAPPCAVHVDFKVHDATALEAEVEIIGGLARGCAAYA